MNKVISFGICPFVQRSLITMNYKKVPYEVQYIDLKNKPDWFLKISPLGKVPVLQVDNDVIFESAVINEYVDEISPPSLHPVDPLKKAKARAFIELSSAVLMDFYNAMIAQEKEDYETHLANFQGKLSSLLAPYQGDFFYGDRLSLVDTSVIPTLQRLVFIPGMFSDLNLKKEEHEKLNRWIAATLEMEEVKNSVPETFNEDFSSYLDDKESYIWKRQN